MTNSLESAVIDENVWRDVGQGSGSTEGKFVDWLTFKDLAESVFVDVKRIRNHPLAALNHSDLWLYLRCENRAIDWSPQRNWSRSGNSSSYRIIVMDDRKNAEGFAVFSTMN